MPKASAAPALPGLEALATPPNVRPAAVDMTDGKVFTAGLLFRSYPDVFKSAATMLFKYLDSERKVAEVLRLSVNTVRAIRDMVTDGAYGADASAAAFLIKSKAANAKRTIQLRALEAIRDRLDDPAALKKIDTSTLLSVARIADSSDKSDTHNKDSSDIIDVDEFDDMINGLNAEKKNAPMIPGQSDPNADDHADDHAETTDENADFNRLQTRAECSMRNTSDGS